MKRQHYILIILFSFFFSYESSHSLIAQSNIALESTFLDALKYRCIGPSRGGRVTTVTGITSNPSHFYMGSTGGGVWKTENYGNTWKNVSDGYFLTPSIGAIRVVQTNPKIVYVGTGSDGIRSNVITGKGVYKSEDAGKSWKHMGLKNVGQIGAIEIHPNDSNTVFVAAIGQAFQPNKERGIFKTTDGGLNWEKVLFIADTIGVADIEFCPDNPNILYAGAWRAERKPWNIISGGMEGGIYKSIDGGSNWKKVKNGLPNGLIGKIDLAVSPAASNLVYALVEAPQGIGGLYLSKNYGESFELVSSKKSLLDRPFYYCNVDVDPKDPDLLYVSSTQFWTSKDAGKTWKRMGTPHGDNHDIWINPDDNNIFIQANDGGANVTLDGGKSWSSQQNQATAELYQVEVDNQIPYRVYAGQQDNSTISLPVLPESYKPGGGIALWEAVGGCETGPAVPKPGNPNIVYSNCKGRFGVYNRETGQEKQYYVGASNIYGHNPKDLKFRFQRVSPIHVSPHNSDVVYHASQYLHKTTNDGETWEIISPDLTAFTPETQQISGTPITRDITGEEFYSTIYSIQESKIKEGMIWVGANDGPVHVTNDGGRNWTNVTPKGLEPGGRVDCVEPSPHNASKAYFSVLRYQLGDWKPYIFKTTNGGNSWTLLTTGDNGIPADYPVRVVREDPDREGLLYAGTEFGMFISFDDGKNWQSFQANMPVTPITDIKVHRKDLVVSTMGRSFWILDNLSPLHEFSESITNKKVHLFQPQNNYRMRYRGTSSKSIPYYPSPSITIDYLLKEDIKSPITLEFINADNEVVRTFSSEKPKKDSLNREVDMATGFIFKGYSPRLKTTKGLNRFKWDMRHYGVWDKDALRSGRGGPMVSPGKYIVRLNLNGETLEHHFQISINPKIEISGVSQADLSAQEELTLKVRDLRSEAKLVLYKTSIKKKALEKVAKSGLPISSNNPKEIDRLISIEKQLTTQEGRYMRPMLLDQLRYLASMLDRADQKPGKDAYERYEELKKWLENLTD
ncbi:MAG: hypothetical protein NXI23_04585 [Bacteroidetes bacterium]|jgi:photosystem II stability/assembly factor-like uncharacterized protein|nr:hypothetical protein [Bacteroidota bacterium]